MSKVAPMIRPSRETIGERRLSHGHTVGRSQSPTYRSWAAMINRCTNAATPMYELYGAAGITVCERWRSFEAFVADMGERPSLAHTLDRYPDMAGGYEPGNCRWATKSEQARNRKTSRPVMRDDGLIFRSMIEAAEATGSNRRCIRDVCTGRQRTHLGRTWRFAE